MQSAESGTTDEPTGTLVIPADFVLCLVPPLGQASQSATGLFERRAILVLEEGVWEVPTIPDSITSTLVPFSLQIDAVGTKASLTAITAETRFFPDAVPAFIADAVDPAPGYETLEYLATFDGEGESSSLQLQLAHPPSLADTPFDAGPLVEQELAKTRRVRIKGFANGVYAPCEAPSSFIDQVDVQLTEGTVTFYTRPGWWGAHDGFTTRAEGEVAGIIFDVDSYWDLAYSSRDADTRAYGYQPTWAVRFPEHESGACILVVEWDAQFDVYEAGLFDCEQELLQPLTIESIEVNAT